MNQKPRKTTSLRPSERAEVYLHYLDLSFRSKEQEERQSEQRIKFFVTLATATVAIIGYFLREKPESGVLLLMTAVSLSILFLFGLITFARIIWRGQTIDQLNGLIKTVSDALKTLHPQFPAQLTSQRLEEPKNALLKKLKGTLAQYLYLTQGLLIAGLTVTIGVWLGSQAVYIAVIAILLAIFVVFLMFKWSQQIRSAQKALSSENRHGAST